MEVCVCSAHDSLSSVRDNSGIDCKLTFNLVQSTYNIILQEVSPWFDIVGYKMV